METKLEKLIEKIKKEGVAAAQKEADEIRKNAQKEARKTVKDAKKESEKLIAEAQKENEKFRQNTEAALKQAHRDTVLVTKEKLTHLLNRVFKRKVEETLQPEFMRELILKIVKNWGKDAKAEVLVSEKDKQQLQKLLVEQSGQDLKEPIDIKVDRGISGGFRIGLKDEHVHYDLTDESITAFLSEFLNPTIRQMLEKK